MSNPHLSVVIPVYNEVRRLKNLKEIADYLKKQPFKSELIVVNDGSSDATVKQLKALKLPLTLVTYKENQGKGYAIKRGMEKSRGEYALFMDVDLSVPLSTISTFLKKPGEVTIATRKIKSAKVLIHQPLMRENLGKVFTWLSQQITGVNVSDFTCGFKLFSKKAAADIFSKSKIKRWSFDAEILYLAKKQGYVIKEIPVVWRNDPSTKVRFPEDLVSSLTDLLRIRFQ